MLQAPHSGVHRASCIVLTHRRCVAVRLAGEVNNVAEQHPDVVAELRARMYAIRDARPRQEQFWMTIDRDLHWASTLKHGDCSHQDSIPDAHCRFAHPWVADDADLSTMAEELVDGSAAWPFVRSTLAWCARTFWLPVAVAVGLVYAAKRCMRKA